MNWHAIRASYRFEMARTLRTLVQSILAPVVTTSLYFVVFGSAIGPRMSHIEGVHFGAFIMPGLIRLSALDESAGNASFGIIFQKWPGTIHELPSAWRTMSLFNLVVYVVSGFRRSFLGRALVDARISFAIITGMLLGCLSVAVSMIRCGWRFRH